MKKLLATILCLITLSASAQTPPDPATTQAVRELLATMKFREQMDSSMQQMMKNMPVMMLQMATQGINNNAKLSAEEKKQQLDKAAKEIPLAIGGMQAVFTDPTLIDDMVNEIVPLYARHFTLEEIRGLAQFYQTPLGAKMLANMPQVMNESMQASQKVIMPRIARHLEKFNK